MTCWVCAAPPPRPALSPPGTSPSPLEGPWQPWGVHVYVGTLCTGTGGACIWYIVYWYMKYMYNVCTLYIHVHVHTRTCMYSTLAKLRVQV